VAILLNLVKPHDTSSVNNMCMYSSNIHKSVALQSIKLQLNAHKNYCSLWAMLMGCHGLKTTAPWSIDWMNYYQNTTKKKTGSSAQYHKPRLHGDR